MTDRHAKRILALKLGGGDDLGPDRRVAVTDPAWIEGFPSAPGDYLFCRLIPGYPSLGKVELGRSFYTSDNVLTHIASDFLYASVNKAPARLWHMQISLPELPPMDRSCPECSVVGR